MEKCEKCDWLWVGSGPAPGGAEATIRHAMDAANTDGYGDEGAGYDMEVFATVLRQHGWVFTTDGVDVKAAGIASRTCETAADYLEAQARELRREGKAIESGSRAG